MKVRRKEDKVDFDLARSWEPFDDVSPEDWEKARWKSGTREYLRSGEVFWPLRIQRYAMDLIREAEKSR